MTPIDWFRVEHIFPLWVAVGELGACIVYTWKGDYLMAIVWGGYAVAATALVFVHG